MSSRLPGGGAFPQGEGALPRPEAGLAAEPAGIAGIGIIRSPLFVVEKDLEAGRLQRILPHVQSVDPDLLAVFPSRRHLPAKVRVFVDFLCDRYGT